MVNDELNEMYEEIVMDHYHNPRNTDLFESPDFEIEKNNPFCGDEIKIQLNFQEDNKVSASVTGRGCAISQASGSLLAEKINKINSTDLQNTVDLFRKLIRSEELTEEELDELGDISALSGVRKFPVRIKCAMLSWVALEDIIKQSNLKN
ncbi:MAG: SUF system NifU family Fe-S cluster assembly protein [Chloroflexi bacterium]|jgi:nitrogen fixation NifU-like protein|nr:SUF system NifU family Fe-S cluster assembly protein [Chloroflexota bacterium]|tara:strand:+ start:2089 stop:2538 length:450 start_codon:yes stop_codon:yes gene_type:complete